MFGFLKKASSINLYSPVTGKVIPLSQVKDPVFATEMMGPGVAFELTDAVIKAPCDGTISIIPESLHAFGLTSSDGIEILVHVGLDTVSLAGDGFESLVTVGMKVKKGTPILKVDINKLLGQEIDLTTPMVVTNSDKFELAKLDVTEVFAGETIILNCKKK